MKTLIIAVILCFSIPVFAGDYDDEVARQLQDNFDRMTLEYEINTLRDAQERRWREEDERREEVENERKLERIRQEIEKEHEQRLEEIQRRMRGEY